MQRLRTLPLLQIEELSHELYRLQGDCESTSSRRIWNKVSQRAQDPRPSAVDPYRFRVLSPFSFSPSSARSPPLTCPCRLYKQQLKAVMKQMTYTKSNINTAPEAGHVSDGAPKGSLRHADFTHKDVAYICTADFAGSTTDTLDM